MECKDVYKRQVVGVDGLALLCQAKAEQFVGPVGDDLVEVHVVAGSGPGLDGVDDELVGPPSGDHLVGGGHDRPGHVGRGDGAVAGGLVGEQALSLIHI